MEGIMNELENKLDRAIEKMNRNRVTMDLKLRLLENRIDYLFALFRKMELKEKEKEIINES
jgi:hypothetical protein